MRFSEDHAGRIPVQFTNWVTPGYAKGISGTENCTFMNIPSGLWETGPCSIERKIICKTLRVTDPPQEEPKIPDEKSLELGVKCPDNWLEIYHGKNLKKCIYPSAVNYGKLKLNSTMVKKPAWLKMNYYLNAKSYCEHISANVSLVNIETVAELDSIYKVGYTRTFFSTGNH